MSNRVLLVRHNEVTTEDRVVTRCREHGLEPVSVFPFKGDRLDDPDDTVRAAVVYGGPFAVVETGAHPFLLDEHRFIEGCIASSVPLLGICQGAQSIAHVLGAYTGPRPGHPHEFGYYPITPTEVGKAVFPDTLHVAQAHYHEFATPAGAELLASSELFPHQAFRYGDCTYAFQFHPEVTKDGFRGWQERFKDDYGNPGVQAKEEQNRLMALHDAGQHVWFCGFLDQFLGGAGTGAKAAEQAPSSSESTTLGRSSALTK